MIEPGQACKEVRDMFEHSGLTLRCVEEKDIENIRCLRNDPSTWMHLTDPIPVTAEMQKSWFAAMSRSSDRMFWVIEDAARKFIGMVRMDQYDRLHRSIRVGADIVPELRGKGYGGKTYGAIKAYCFDVLNLHRVWLCVLANNGTAHRLYERQGFREEGRLRDAIFRDGRYNDYVVMSILEEEYRR